MRIRSCSNVLYEWGKYMFKVIASIKQGARLGPSGQAGRSVRKQISIRPRGLRIVSKLSGSVRRRQSNPVAIIIRRIIRRASSACLHMHAAIDESSLIHAGVGRPRLILLRRPTPDIAIIFHWSGEVHTTRNSVS